MSIKFTKPNPNIEIHLPNGKTLTGPRGTAVEEFLAKAKNDYPAPIVAAVINNEIHELTYPVSVESTCVPITMETADGARIYRRSLIFLLELAFSQCAFEGSLNIDHSVSSGGYYCVVRGRDPLSQAELDALDGDPAAAMAAWRAEAETRLAALAALADLQAQMDHGE